MVLSVFGCGWIRKILAAFGRTGQVCAPGVVCLPWIFCRPEGAASDLSEPVRDYDFGELPDVYTNSPETYTSADRQRDCRIEAARMWRRAALMANSTFDPGLARTSARLAHAFLREQVLAVVAPIHYLRLRREAAVTGRTSSDAPSCEPAGSIDLQPTGARRS